MKSINTLSLAGLIGILFVTVGCVEDDSSKNNNDATTEENVTPKNNNDATTKEDVTPKNNNDATTKEDVTPKNNNDATTKEDVTPKNNNDGTDKKRLFITEWNVVADKPLVIVAEGKLGTNYTVDCGGDVKAKEATAEIDVYNEKEGKLEKKNATGFQCTFATKGKKTIRILPITSGYIRMNCENNYDSKTKKGHELTTLTQWGTNRWKSMVMMFKSCDKFNLSDHVMDSPDTSHVTNMLGMFWDATSFNEDISGWNTTNVTDMSGMFYHATVFNQNIRGWDTSNVTNMQAMFYNATNFKQDLSTWTVDKVDSYSVFAEGSAMQPSFLPKFAKK